MTDKFFYDCFSCEGFECTTAADCGECAGISGVCTLHDCVAGFCVDSTVDGNAKNTGENKAADKNGDPLPISKS